MTTLGKSEFKAEYFFDHFDELKEECMSLYDLTFSIEKQLAGIKNDNSSLLSLIEREIK